MQMMDSVTVWLLGTAAVSALSVSLYAALPRKLLAYAERHGRFQGLLPRETISSGTRAGAPPATRVSLAV